MNWRPMRGFSLCFLLLTIGFTGVGVRRVTAADLRSPTKVDLPKDATVGVTASQLSRALTVVAETRLWEPQVNDEISRGRREQHIVDPIAVDVPDRFLFPSDLVARRLATNAKHRRPRPRVVGFR